MINYMLATEKAVRLLENNMMTFIVEEKARKQDIKKEIEETFKVEILKIRMLNTTKGKKAYVTLKKGDAKDIATQLGMI